MRAPKTRLAFAQGPGRRLYDNIKTMERTDAISALNALAQESRLDIFRYLIQAGAAGASAGRIGGHLGLHAATLSFHLNALKQAGLVSARRESRSIIYTASFARMSELMGYLTQNCCRGAAPRAALEPGSSRAA